MAVIYVSIGLMALLGIAFGVVLAVASKKFAVHMDPRAERVYEVLPHIDCGACGQKGCRDYAAKVAAGEVPVDLCVPGGVETARSVAAIMGVPFAEDRVPTRAVVHCQGGRGEAVEEFQYDGVPDCRAAVVVQGGPKACKFGCIGFGTCAEVCPYDAIEMSEGRLPMIDEAKCVSCGLCVKACPRQLITLMPKTQRVILGCSNHERGKVVKDACNVGCIACGICVKQSKESGAVQLVENLPVIDYDKWTDAEQAACMEKCPMHCYWRQASAEEVVPEREEAEAVC